MTNATAIARLLDLRRLRERSALDALTRCEGDCSRAEQQVEAARYAVAHHLAEARTHEQGKRRALVGRAVSATEIAALQADLDAMAHDPLLEVRHLVERYGLDEVLGAEAATPSQRSSG